MRAGPEAPYSRKSSSRYYTVVCDLPILALAKLAVMNPAMIWTQNYGLHAPLLYTLLAALPIVLLLGLLASNRVTAHTAALIGLVTAILTAIFAFAPEQVQSAGYLAWSQTVL